MLHSLFDDTITAYENVRNCIFVLVLAFLADPTNCKHNELVRFTQKIVTDLTLAKDPAFVVHFAHEEERQKLCYYAKMVADLAYVNYDNKFVPTWNTVESSDFSYGMACATLPSSYIVRRPLNPVLEITYIQHAADQFKFDPNITVVRSVEPIEVSSPEKMEEDTPVESDWIKLSAEIREHLCSAARERVIPLHFLHHEVPAAETYVFEDLEGATETRDAFCCPTVPRLYLRPGNSENEVQIVHLPTDLDDLELVLVNTKVTVMYPTADEVRMYTNGSLSRLSHEDRKSLCNAARRYNPNGLAQDSDEKKPLLFPLQYPSQEFGVYYETLICQTLPRMYLRSDLKMGREKKTKIFVTFAETSADLYSYVLEVVTSAYRKVVPGEKEQSLLEDHPFFSTISEEDVWNFCSSAQKNLIIDGKGRDLNFTFAQHYGIFYHPKVLLIPGQVQTPQAYEIERLDKVWETDILIKCSEWPRMFLRRGQSEKEIKVILMKYELETLPTQNEAE